MSTPPKVYGFSHIGHRAENQDRFKIFNGWDKDQSLLAVVADGMGGHEGGSIAAQTAMNTAERLWPTRHLYPNPQAFLTDLVNLAHNAIVAAGKRIGADPRTTLVVLYLKGDQAISMHIGDSRVMQFNKQRCIKRTRDHSVAELQFQRGKITEEQISQHPDQNKLTKSLGKDEAAEPDFEHWDIPRNTTFVICSDGFWSLWDDKQLPNMLQNIQSTATLQIEIKNALKARSKHDNATAIIVRPAGGGFSLSLGGGTGDDQWRAPIIAFVGFGLLVLIGIFFLLAPIFTAPTQVQRPKQNTQATLQQKDLPPEQLFANPSPTTTEPPLLPDFETAMSETEKMLENLDQASWEAATQKNEQPRESVSAQQDQPRRPIKNETIWEPISEPYINARAAAKTVAAHLQKLGIFSPDDTLMAKAIDTVSPLDPTPVRVEFSHNHKGILVLNSRLWVDIDNRQMIQIGGRPAQHLSIDKNPKLSFEEAKKLAQESGIDQLATDTRELLVVFRGKDLDHLGWMIEGKRAGATETVIISARDGSKLFSQRTVYSN
jgi:serine/threonine protein phosphatase PrpC